MASESLSYFLREEHPERSTGRALTATSVHVLAMEARAVPAGGAIAERPSEQDPGAGGTRAIFTWRLDNDRVPTKDLHPRSSRVPLLCAAVGDCGDPGHSPGEGLMSQGALLARQASQDSWPSEEVAGADSHQGRRQALCQAFLCPARCPDVPRGQHLPSPDPLAWRAPPTPLTDWVGFTVVSLFTSHWQVSLGWQLGDGEGPHRRTKPP